MRGFGDKESLNETLNQMKKQNIKKGNARHATIRHEAFAENNVNLFAANDPLYIRAESFPSTFGVKSKTRISTHFTA